MSTTSDVADAAHVPAADPTGSGRGTAALVEIARDALAEIAPVGAIGEDVTVARDGDVRTVAFESLLPGYRQWRWTAQVAVLPDLEPTGLAGMLLPGDGALVAPPWVPWADRLAEYRRLHPDDPDGLLAGASDEADDDDDDLDDEGAEDVADDDDLDEELEIADPDDFDGVGVDADDAEPGLDDDDDDDDGDDDGPDDDDQDDEAAEPDDGVPEPDDRAGSSRV